MNIWTVAGHVYFKNGEKMLMLWNGVCPNEDTAIGMFYLKIEKYYIDVESLGDIITKVVDDRVVDEYMEKRNDKF